MKICLLNICIISALLACLSCGNRAFQKAPEKNVEEKESLLLVDSLVPGVAVHHAAVVNYLRGGKPVLNIRFSAPTVISVADRPYKWGYFQFPRIGRMRDGSVHIRWRLNDDAMEAYGNHRNGEAVSVDGKAPFRIVSQEQEPYTDIILPGGDRLTIHTPKPFPEKELQLPEAIGGAADTYSKSTTKYFRLNELPEKAQAVYFERLAKNATEWKTETAKLTDPQAARHTLRGFLPVIWWGDMRLAKDSSIVAGIYPGFFVQPDGKADPFHHVFFYRSTDEGRNWNIQGRIMYTPDLAIDKKANQRMGYTEPAYEVLPDGTMICILRTTDGIGNGPMYVSRSADNGVTWSKPTVLTASGVLPQLLQLENGVLVLASGRPGVQVRFSNDGKGEVWSNAFEMLPWMDYKDQVSCGYTALMATGPDRFMIVYSDFRYVNENGELRKAIKLREVIVQPK